MHEIDSHISDGIAVKNSPGGDTTTVNLVAGGMINWLSAIEDSEIIISGGAIFQDPFMGGWLSAADNSVVTILGGGIWSDLNAFHNVQITIAAGEIRGSVVAGYSSQITISGGVVRANLLAADRWEHALHPPAIRPQIKSMNSRAC